MNLLGFNLGTMRLEREGSTIALGGVVCTVLALSASKFDVFVSFVASRISDHRCLRFSMMTPLVPRPFNGDEDRRLSRQEGERNTLLQAVKWSYLLGYFKNLSALGKRYDAR